MQTYVCAPLMASINGLICPHPPDAIRLTEAEYQRFNTLSGWDIDRRGNGRVAEWSWGERAVTAETVQWLRNVLDLDEPYAIAWNEPDESAHAFQAIMEGEEFEWSWFKGGLYHPFRLLFLETVPGAGGVYGSGGAIVGSTGSGGYGTSGSGVPTGSGSTPPSAPPASLAPMWSAASPPSPVTVNQPYSYQFIASGAPTYSIVGGMFPGVTLHPYTGVLSGTPWSVGSWTFFVKAENPAGFVIASVTVTVTTPSGMSISAFPAPLDFPFGSPASYQFAVSGGTGPYTYTQTGGTMPAGLTLSSAGLLSGSAAAAVGSEFNFILTVTDSASGFVQTAVWVRIVP